MISIIFGVIEGVQPRRGTPLSTPAATRHRLVSYLCARISPLTTGIGICACVLEPLRSSCRLPLAADSFRKGSSSVIFGNFPSPIFLPAKPKRSRSETEAKLKRS